MQLTQIRKELESVVFERLRVDTVNYFEAVIVRNELEKLTAILERLFGLPVSHSENSLSLEIREMINTFGGIKSGQTLYFWNQGNDIVIVMLWPWEDAWHTTVKIIQK